MQAQPSTIRRRTYGLLGIAAIVLIVAVAILTFQKAFVPVVRVTLQADRSGLLMEPGSDVRLLGVSVGEVRDIQLDEKDPSSVRADLALDEDKAARVPADVTAKLLPNTAFGAKFVNLIPPPGRPAPAIKAGTVIQTTEVTTEVNNLFMGLKQMINAVEPSKVNATLGAMARTLNGRGNALGGYLTRVNSYLDTLEPHLPNMQRDIARSADVVGDYAKVAPDFLRLAQHTTQFSGTLSESAATLHTLLIDATRTAGKADTFLGRVEEPLGAAMGAFKPVLELLDGYSPEFKCLVQGLNENRRRISVFGSYYSGAQALVSFLPGQEGYKYPRDLPKFVTGDGPDCFVLPNLTRAEYPPPHVRFDDGAQGPWRRPTDAPGAEELVNVYPDKLFELLFGEMPQKVFGKPLQEVLPR